MSKPLKISEEAAVQMPMKTVASLIMNWVIFGLVMIIIFAGLTGCVGFNG